MNIKELIKNGTSKLIEHNIEDSNVKANLLLQHILNKDRNYLIINNDIEVSKDDELKYYKYLQEIIDGKPMQYITNHQEFMGLDFYVDENVLIPQPDTEILVEETIREIVSRVSVGKTYETFRILDLCTGSGCVAISIAKYIKKKIEELNKNKQIKFEIYGVDISSNALSVAEKNAKSNQVQVKWIKSDMYQRIKEITTHKFDFIISNPPYIETKTIEELPKEVKREPYIALDGGEDGLEFYRIIAKSSREYLKENGCILVEIGYNQKDSVIKIFEDVGNYKNIICMKDLAGNNRVIKIKNV